MGDVLLQKVLRLFQASDQDKIDQSNGDQGEEGLHGPAPDQIAGAGQFHNGDVARNTGLLDKGCELRRDERNKAPPCLGQDDLPESPFLFVAQSQGGFALAGVHRFKRIPDNAEGPCRKDQGKTDHSHNNGGERCLPEYNVVEDHEDDDRRNTGNQTAVDRYQTVEYRIVPVP